MIGEIGLNAIITRLHASFASRPSSGADLAVLLEELDRVDRPEELIDVTAERQVVDHRVPADAVGINEIGATCREAAVSVNHVVGLTHGLRRVSEERVAQRTNASFIDSGVAPARVCLSIIHGYAQNLDASLLELTYAVVESDELRRSDEGEVLRVKEERDVFA